MELAKKKGCLCSVCSNPNTQVKDNFEQIGKNNFTKLALSALDILALNTQAKPSIDK